MARQRKDSAALQPPSNGNGRNLRGQFAPGNPYRWAAGVSGNPSGSKGPKVSDLVIQVMNMPMPKNGKQALKDLIDSGATIGQIIAFTAGLQAAKGSPDARNFVTDRTEGSPKQRTELTGADGGPVQVLPIREVVVELPKSES